MVDWPIGCGELLNLNGSGWTEWYASSGDLYKEHFWNPEQPTNDFHPDKVCGSTRCSKYWRYYCSRCARKSGLLW